MLFRFAEQNLRDCREELQSKTEELRSVLESSTIAENELREEAKLRKRYMPKKDTTNSSVLLLGHIYQFLAQCFLVGNVYSL